MVSVEFWGSGSLPVTRFTKLSVVVAIRETVVCRVSLIWLLLLAFAQRDCVSQLCRVTGVEGSDIASLFLSFVVIAVVSVIVAVVIGTVREKHDLFFIFIFVVVVTAVVDTICTNELSVDFLNVAAARRGARRCERGSASQMLLQQQLILQLFAFVKPLVSDKSLPRNVSARDNDSRVAAVSRRIQRTNVQNGSFPETGAVQMLHTQIVKRILRL